MRGTKRVVMIAMAAVMGAESLPGGGAQAADAEEGKALATRWCASCHIVSTEQTRGTAGVPPFSEVAARGDFDAARVALFLLAPHPKMPDMNLTRSEAADLSAYIATFKK